MGRKLVVLGGFFMLLLATSSLSAQVRVGPQVNYADDAEFGIGARAMIDFSALPGFGIIGSFDYFFPGVPDLGTSESDIGFDYWEINGNLFFAFPVTSASFEPYLGAGLNLAHASADAEGISELSDDSQTEVGLNLLAGFVFPMTGLTPFIEVRIELGGDEDFVVRGDNQIVVTGGLLFP